MQATILRVKRHSLRLQLFMSIPGLLIHVFMRTLQSSKIENSKSIVSHWTDCINYSSSPCYLSELLYSSHNQHLKAKLPRGQRKVPL